MKTAREIRNYMMNNYEDHIDYTCNVLNMTSLAEDACDHFQDYIGEDYTVPDDYYDTAYEVNEYFVEHDICQN
jgi:hypothetical protein